MSTNINRAPFPLGLLKPGATFASASVALTVNYADLAVLSADSVVIQALPGNSGNIYICSTAATPDLTTYVNVLFVLPAGAYWDNASSALNTVPLGSYYVGGDNADDAAIGQVRFR